MYIILLYYFQQETVSFTDKEIIWYAIIRIFISVCRFSNNIRWQFAFIERSISGNTVFRQCITIEISSTILVNNFELVKNGIFLRAIINFNDNVCWPRCEILRIYNSSIGTWVYIENCTKMPELKYVTTKKNKVGSKCGKNALNQTLTHSSKRLNPEWMLMKLL